MLTGLMMDGPSDAWAGKSMAVLKFDALKVSNTEADSIRQQVLALISKRSEFTPLSVRTMEQRDPRTRKAATQLCGHAGADCYGDVARQLQVDCLMVGVVEKLEAKIAIELKIFDLKERDFIKSEVGFARDGSVTIDQAVAVVTEKLVGSYGTLMVIANVKDADVLVDGQVIGTVAQGNFDRVRIGKRRVQIRRKGYSEFSGEVTVRPVDVVRVETVLAPFPHKLDIESNVVGAKVYIGETAIGFTPIHGYQIQTFGTFVLKLSKPDYFDASRVITIDPGGETRLRIMMSTTQGTLQVLCNELDAEVFLDGASIGLTPIETIPAVSNGKHELKLIKANFYPYLKQIVVKPGKTLRIDADLKPLFGQLSVTSNESNAQILIDGQAIGQTPYDSFVEIERGRHRLRVEKANFFPYERDIKLSPGKKNVVFAELKTMLGVLNIRTPVIGARVKIDGKLIGLTPLDPIGGIRMGDHNLSVSHPDYFPEERSFALQGGETKDMPLRLRSLSGSLKVISNVKGAQVTLDRELLGVTPFAVPQKIAVGEHEIAVVANGYHPYRGKISIESDAVATKEIALEPILGSLSIKSTIDPVQVYQDDRLLGTTPLELINRIPVGALSLSLRKNGYRDETIQVVVRDGQTTVVVPALIALPAKLSVTSDPDNAKVFLGSKLLGVTPISGMAITKFGPYALRVEKRDFQSIIRDVDIQPGEQISLKFDLRQSGGSIDLKISPNGSRVFVDDRLVGTSPIEQLKGLAAGEHQVRAVHDGYVEQTKTVSVGPGAQRLVTIQLLSQFGRISIDSTVRQADVFLDNHPLGQTPLKIVEQVEPGAHELRVTKDGYYPFKTAFQISSNELVAIPVKLARVLGGLQVTANVTDADVFLDGDRIGKAPFQLAEGKPVGNYRLRVSKVGYADFSQDIVIRDRAVTRVKALLEAKPAILSVRGGEVGAEVALDGKKIGVIPIERYRLDRFGEHTLRIRPRGASATQRTLIVEPGDQLDIDLGRAEVFGSLRLTIEPDDARVVMNGQDVGSTPLSPIQALKPGVYYLSVTKPGYLSKEQAVEVGSGEETEVSIRLKGALALLAIRSKPPLATVRIDGKKIGKTDLRQRLEPGLHKIDVTKTGYIPVSKTVTLRPGFRGTLRVTLERKRQ